MSSHRRRRHDEECGGKSVAPSPATRARQSRSRVAGTLLQRCEMAGGGPRWECEWREVTACRARRRREISHVGLEQLCTYEKRKFAQVSLFGQPELADYCICFFVFVCRCSSCDKRFTRKGNMQRHEITHSNAKYVSNEFVFAPFVQYVGQ